MMKKNCKKLWLLAAVMTLIASFVFSASAATENVDYGSVALNQQITLDFDYSYDEESEEMSGVVSYWLAFTPEQSGNYCIESSNYSSGADPYVYYYGTEKQDDYYYEDYWGSNDDGAGDWNFYYSTYLDSGYTYYFRCTTNGHNNTGSYDVVIRKTCYHDNVKYFGITAPTCTQPGLTARTVCSDCGKIISGGSVISAMHTDENNDLACDKCNAKITIIASGSCGNKATYEYYSSGLLKIKGSGTFDSDYYLESEDFNRGDIRKVIIESGITEIPYGAFYNCTALESIQIPSTVGYIGSEAFWKCESLKSITIPETVEQIFYNTFSYCISLTSVNIPVNISYIDSSAFYGCSSITGFTVSAGNDKYSADAAGALYNYDKTSLIIYPAGSAAASFTIPSTVENIYGGVFDYAKNLKKLICYDYNLYVDLWDSSIEEVVGYPHSRIQESADDNGIKFTPVANVTLSGIKVKKAPFKTVYGLQEYFSTTGMELVAVMSDGAELELAPDRADRDIYVFTKGGTITVTFTFRQKTAKVQVSVVDQSSFTLTLDTPKSITGSDNYLYFTPAVTDDYLFTVDTDAAGEIALSRYSSTDEEGIDYYRETDYAYFNKDSDAKEGAFRLIKGVKYRIAVYLYDDSEEDLKASGGEVTVTYDCEHENAKDYAQQNPTCTAKGYSAGTYCSDCKKWIKGHDEISALGHSITATLIISPATTKSDGVVTGRCGVCNSVLSKATVAKIASVELSQNEFDYNGKAKKPSVIVTDSNGRVLTEGTDYITVYASGRKAMGTYSVSVKFIGNYSGSEELKFKIVFGTATLKAKAVKTDSMKITWSKVPTAKTYEVYRSTNGKKWTKIATTKKTSYTDKKLKAGTTYKYKVKAVSGSNTSTSKVLTQSTKPVAVTLSSVKAGKKQFTANWKTVKGATGYEVVYSTTKKFTAKTTNKVTVKKQKTKKTTVKKLTKGKKYFVKVRAYRTVNGTKIYGAYSKVKTVTVK